jgi:hypothetical protein
LTSRPAASVGRGLRWGDLGLAGLYALIAREDQRFGVGVLLLVQEAAAEQAAGVEGGPLVGLALLANGQAIAQDGLGRGPFALLDEILAELSQGPGSAGVSGPQLLAGQLQRIAEQRLGFARLRGFQSAGPALDAGELRLRRIERRRALQERIHICPEHSPRLLLVRGELGQGFGCTKSRQVGILFPLSQGLGNGGPCLGRAGFEELAPGSQLGPQPVEGLLPQARVRSLLSSLAASSPCPAAASDARTLLSWHADPRYTDTMSETATLDTESEILEQVIEPGSTGMSPEAAQALLRFRFNAAAAARMNDLAEKNRKGTIEPAERALLERYLRVGNFLNLIHAKARCALAEPASPAS